MLMIFLELEVLLQENIQDQVEAKLRKRFMVGSRGGGCDREMKWTTQLHSPATLLFSQLELVSPYTKTQGFY